MATIAENLQTIIDIKDNIKTAIENKGVDMTNTPFSEYSTKIDEITTGGVFVVPDGMKFSKSTFTTLPDSLDFSNVTDMSYMFHNCLLLTTIPVIDTSNTTDMYHMFNGCNNLITIPQLNTTNVTTMNYMFSNCKSLTTIPQLNTAKVTIMYNMFNGCKSLSSLPLFNCGEVNDMGSFFGYSSINTLTHLGGFKDLKISVTSEFIDLVPNLTIESLMNVINNLYDLTANGLSGETLVFGQTNLDKLSAEQIAVATAKGWTLTA